MQSVSDDIASLPSHVNDRRENVMKHKKRKINLLIMALICLLLPAFTARAEETAPSADDPAATVTFTNAPNNQPDLYITKTVTSTDTNATVPDTSFYFIVKIKESGVLKAYANQNYTLQDEDGTLIKDSGGNQYWKTDGNGMLQLKAGQTARFEYVGINKTFNVQEVNLLENFTCVNLPSGTADGTIGQNGVTLTFNNQYSVKTQSDDGSLTVGKKVSYETYEYTGDEDFGFTLIVDGVPAKSVTYAIKDLESGTETGTYGKTDENGRFTLKSDTAAIFRELEGSVDYTVTEDERDDGWHAIGETSHSGNTSDNDTVYFYNTNTAFVVKKKLTEGKDDNAVFTFQLFDGARKTWQDAEYMLYTTAGKRIAEDGTYKVYQTDANGKFRLKQDQMAIFINIAPDTAYSVEEVAPGESGYVQQTPADARGYANKTVTANGLEVLAFENVPMKHTGAIYVTKKLTYANEGEAPLEEEEFTFQILKEDGNGGFAPVSQAEYTLGSETTKYAADENGGFTLFTNQTAIFTGLALDKTYKVVETGLDGMPGYDIEVNEQSGELMADRNLVFTFENVYTARHFDLQICKRDSGTGEKLLAGAEFELYTDAGMTSRYTDEKLVTGGDGTVTLSGMKEGIYYLKEVVAPENYKLMKEPVRIAVKRVLNDENEEVLEAEVEQQDGAVIKAVMEKIERDEEGTTDTLVINVQDDDGRIYTLPSTGGTGRGLFTIVGLAVMILMALLFVRRQLGRA